MEHTTSTLDPESGADQVALTDAAQLAVGQILTGQGWQTVRQVTDFSDGKLVLLDLGRPVPAPSHVHEWTGRSGKECAGCGAMLIEPAALLPVDGFCRTYIIQPRGDAANVLTPDAFTVYLTSSGTELIVGHDGKWTRPGAGVAPATPIVPVLHPAWTLPEPLRRWVRTLQAHADRE